MARFVSGRRTEDFSDDPWVYGLEANAHVIEKSLSYCYDLGTSERRVEAKDLFDPSTWTLREQTV